VLTPERQENPQADPAEINGLAIDRFTAAHFLWGYALGSLGVSPLLTLTLAIAWELGENRLKDRYPYMFTHPTHDTGRNATVDVLAMILGRRFERYQRTGE